MVVRKVTYLENIGALLKERRQELNYSLEDMSEKTKLSIVQLEAIESGNIQLFEDDLSYLSYFVRYYSNALGIDYNEIREQLDDSIMAYTDSISISKVKSKEAMNERVFHQAQSGSKSKRNVDFSSIGLFVITLIIMGLLIFAVVRFVVPAVQSKESNEPPIVQLPDDVDENTTPDETPTVPVEEPEEEEEELVEKELLVTEIDSTTYEISGWEDDEELTINLDFRNRAWTRFTEDGVALDVPSQGIYESGENAQVILKASEGKVLAVNVGYFNGNIFSLNGEEIAINPEVASSTGSYVIDFKIVEGESAE